MIVRQKHPRHLGWFRICLHLPAGTSMTKSLMLLISLCAAVVIKDPMRGRSIHVYGGHDLARQSRTIHQLVEPFLGSAGITG